MDGQQIGLANEDPRRGKCVFTLIMRELFCDCLGVFVQEGWWKVGESPYCIVFWDRVRDGCCVSVKAIVYCCVDDGVVFCLDPRFMVGLGDPGCLDVVRGRVLEGFGWSEFSSS